MSPSTGHNINLVQIYESQLQNHIKWNIGWHCNFEDRHWNLKTLLQKPWLKTTKYAVGIQVNPSLRRAVVHDGCPREVVWLEFYKIICYLFKIAFNFFNCLQFGNFGWGISTHPFSDCSRRQWQLSSRGGWIEMPQI
jgi:hypothetical protein